MSIIAQVEASGMAEFNDRTLTPVRLKVPEVSMGSASKNAKLPWI